MNWWENLKGKVKREEPLKNHTTFKIGGPAKYYVEPENEEDLKLLLSFAKECVIPFFVIGAGSNLLVNDRGVEGIVVKLNSPHFKSLFLDNGALVAGAGCLLSEVIKYSREHCVSALEFLTGIPGTIGGAVVMNAGIPGKNIGDLIEEVTIMDYNADIKTLNKKEINFGYRNSSLSQCVVLAVRAGCNRKKKEEIEITIKNFLNERKSNQDLSLPSAGCVFKNPQTLGPAGRLIDLCGLKGRRIGGACVSAKHANFIVNVGNANADDVSRLMKLITEEVKNMHKITLEPEILIWK